MGVGGGWCKSVVGKYDQGRVLFGPKGDFCWCMRGFEGVHLGSQFELTYTYIFLVYFGKGDRGGGGGQ